MATIVLVRHATTAATGKRLGGRTPGVHLDEAGVAQAEDVAARLATMTVAAVHASPMERTMETAAIVARPHGLEPVVDDGLNEVDYGTWSDRTLKQVRTYRLWPVIQSTPSRVTFPDGESIRGAQARAVEAIEAMADRYGDAVALAVSHADVIKAVVAHFLGMHLDSFQRIVVSPASATVLHLPAHGRPAVVRLNDTGSLGGP